MDNINVPQVNECTAPTLPGEEWRKIVDDKLLPNYWISNHGRVWSNLTQKMLTQALTKAGYWCIHISSTQGHPAYFLTHRLVAKAFLPPPEDGRNVVDHIDGNPQNNQPSNLRWCTTKENIHNPNTIHNNHRGCRETAARKGHMVKVEGYDEPFPSAKAVAEFFGLCVGQVRGCCRTGKPLGERSGINGDQGLHIEYVMNDFDAQSMEPVTLADALAAAKIPDDKYPGQPIRCIEDDLAFPSVTALAKAYHTSIAAVVTSRDRTANGSYQSVKKGFRLTHHYENLTKEEYIKWLEEHTPAQEG